MTVTTVDLDKQLLAGFTIYHPDGSQILQISGGSVSAEVQSGSLAIKSGNEVRLIFSPGQWSTVNHQPK